MTTSVQAAGQDRPASTFIAIAYSLLVLWAVYLLLAPTTGFDWIDSWHNEQRAVQVILLSLTGAAFAGLIALGPDPIRARLQFPSWWWAFVAIGAASAMHSQIPLAAFAEVGLFVLLSALVMITATLASQRSADSTGGTPLRAADRCV